MTYPRQIRSVHQVEISTFCSLKCSYCPSPNIDKPIHGPSGTLLPIGNKGGGGFGREREHIARDVFERALEWCVRFEAEGTQGELALTGIGEALLHPEITDLIRLAREALPHNLLTLSTNGTELAKGGKRADELLDALQQGNVRTYVSLHRPEKAKLAIDLLAERGLLADTNTAFADANAMDWAGALEWKVNAPEITCEFLRTGWSVVLADGRFATCCLDAEGASTVGTVWDEIGSLSIAPWKGARGGCDTCYQRVPDEHELVNT